MTETKATGMRSLPPGWKVSYVNPDVDIELAKRIVAYMNELAQLDRCAIASLVGNRIPCNNGLADHRSCQAANQHGGTSVSVLGVLNGLCGVYLSGPRKGSGPIAAKFANHGGDLLEFILIENKEGFTS